MSKYNVWFTSDLHFGHKNILKYEPVRPWRDVEAMNQGLVDNWNAVVDERDSVWVLGDVVWGKVSSAAPYLEQLKGTKFLVPGNHDTVWAGHKKPSSVQEWKKFGFRVMPGNVGIRTNGLEVLMCHFPYVTAHYTDERYDQYKPRDRGEWLLHGHVHSAWKVQDRQINVGVDVWDLAPVHSDAIREIVRAQ